MHGTTQFATMPPEFLTDPSIWDGFIGQVWHVVLAPLAVPHDATVIEIAPGSSAKIAHALAACDFAGTLHLVESSPAALDIALAKYRALLPAATIIAHPMPLTDALAELPMGADAVLASHALDDMLLAHAPAAATFDWATRYSDTVSTDTQAAWHAISTDAATLAQAINATTAMLTTALAALGARHVVFNQYPSATLRDNHLSALNDAAFRVLDDLKARLQITHVINDCTPQLAQLPHYNNAHIGQHVLNPRYWLSCTQTI